MKKKKKKKKRKKVLIGNKTQIKKTKKKTNKIKYVSINQSIPYKSFFCQK